MAIHAISSVSLVSASTLHKFTIQSVELIEINMPLVHFFETSFGRTYERRIILVRVEDADGGEGWGEVTCGESPGTLTNGRIRLG